MKRGVREFALFVAGRPQPKERPRFNRKTGQAYTPDKTRKAEQRLGDLWFDAGGPNYPAGTPLEVELVFNRDGSYVIVRPVEREKIHLRGDIDNYVKTALDGLNEVAWADDVQIVSLKVTKE